MILTRGHRWKKKKIARSRRNPLRRLIPDKRIQGNPSFFLGKIWLNFGLAWLDFAEFRVGFDEPNRRLFSDLAALIPDAAGGTRKNACPPVAKSRLNSQIHARSAPAAAPARSLKAILAAGQAAIHPSQMEYR
jgi:hypothetical protein